MTAYILLWFILISTTCWGGTILWRQKATCGKIASELSRFLTRSQQCFFVFIVLYAMCFAYESTSSDADVGVALIALGLPVAMFLGIRSLVQLIRQKHHFLTKLSLLGAVTFGPVLAYYGVWLIQNPLFFKGVRYEFDYGRSSTWHEIQFSYIRDEDVIKGPWIGGFPLRVSFPDIDRDGYRDIRVTGNGRLTEYRFLPGGRGGKQYWTLIQNSGYKISYAVDGYYFP